jgi:tRNA pseudouridine32 synthase / 23S rRNA pseudouridine746 synthase
MKILFEDSNIVAVEKPAGWLSVPSSKGKEDKREIVGIKLQDQLKTTLFPLHRLDFEVSGVLAFAKNPKTQSQILGLWEKGEVQKVYRALTLTQNFSHWPENVEGLMRGWPEKNPWVSLLVAGKRRAFVAKHGSKSITNWKTMNEQAPHIEWELEPVTGRRHQLRVELSRRGFPILGDQLYGSVILGPQDEIALKAISLQIKGYPVIKTDFDSSWSWDLWLKK